MSGKHGSRREFLRSVAVVSAGIALGGGAREVAAKERGLGEVLHYGVPTAQMNVQSGYVHVNGASVFYYMSGQGEPMLLLHGYPLSGALFDRNREALAQRYRLITIDHRGYGISRAPGIPDLIAMYAQDALAVMDHLGVPRAIIGGHSMGGPITFEMYKRAPERFRGMLLIDTIASSASTIEAALWRGFAEEARQQGISMTYINNLIKEMLSGDTRANQPALVNYLTTVIKLASVDAAIGGALALATRPDYMGLLSQIRVPTLVYVGVEDTVYPVPISQMMAQAIPNSTLVTIPGASHAAVFEAPERTNEAILNWANSIG